MPRYRGKTSDGKPFDFEAPAGMTPEDLKTRATQEAKIGSGDIQSGGSGGFFSKAGLSHFAEKEDAARNAILSGLLMPVGGPVAGMAAAAATPFIGRAVEKGSEFLRTGSASMPTGGEMAADVGEAVVGAGAGHALKYAGGKVAALREAAENSGIGKWLGPAARLGAISSAAMGHVAPLATDLSTSRPVTNFVQALGENITPQSIGSSFRSVGRGLRSALGGADDAAKQIKVLPNRPPLRSRPIPEAPGEYTDEMRRLMEGPQIDRYSPNVSSVDSPVGAVAAEAPGSVTPEMQAIFNPPPVPTGATATSPRLVKAGGSLESQLDEVVGGLKQVDTVNTPVQEISGPPSSFQMTPVYGNPPRTRAGMEPTPVPDAPPPQQGMGDFDDLDGFQVVDDAGPTSMGDIPVADHKLGNFEDIASQGRDALEGLKVNSAAEDMAALAPDDPNFFGTQTTSYGPQDASIEDVYSALNRGARMKEVRSTAGRLAGIGDNGTNANGASMREAIRAHAVLEKIKDAKIANQAPPSTIPGFEPF